MREGACQNICLHNQVYFFIGKEQAFKEIIIFDNLPKIKAF